MPSRGARRKTGTRLRPYAFGLTLGMGRTYTKNVAQEQGKLCGANNLTPS
jgi:hypothetical protein